MLCQNYSFQNLGLVDYLEAFEIQNKLLEKRAQNKIADTILFCSHPSVVTLGRASQSEDLTFWKGQTIKTNRGGRATYHGPGQLICYPIVSLKNNSNLKIKEQDIRVYLESLENIIISFLKIYGVQATAESGKPLEKGQLNRGVWVQGKKIASMGIAVKKWVTQHGFALNLKKDSQAFTGIHACGFSTETYTSLEGFLGETVDLLDAQEKMQKIFQI